VAAEFATWGPRPAGKPRSANLRARIGAALDTDPPLASLALGLTNGRPAAPLEALRGAPAIKSAPPIHGVDWQRAMPLS
jgi:hypothetical protein